MSVRAFVALETPAEIARALIREHPTLDHEGGDMRWAGAEALHVTLVFLGQVTSERIEAIGACVRRVAAGTSPFKIALGAPGGFPDLERPRVIWVGLREGEQACRQLQQRLVSALEPLGFVPERRPFHPHLTLARVRRPGRRGVLRGALTAWPIPPPGWISRRMVLFGSDLTPQGAVHTPLVSAPFGEGVSGTVGPRT